MVPSLNNGPICLILLTGEPGYAGFTGNEGRKGESGDMGLEGLRGLAGQTVRSLFLTRLARNSICMSADDLTMDMMNNVKKLCIKVKGGFQF